ncbi:MAG: hypothetical protein ACKV22_35680 [Bryobacteraceae bacterium]
MSEPAKTLEWPTYPTVEKVLTEDAQDLFERMQKTCRRLEDFTKSGTPQEQNRARAAMAAYGRAMELLRVLAQARDKLAAEAK